MNIIDTFFSFLTRNGRNTVRSERGHLETLTGGPPPKILPGTVIVSPSKGPFGSAASANRGRGRI